ncbi:MAG: hypothetical protein HY672_03840 [Chloroflexi bacterium]|nr:hypothetical protein [Chloroflexota bacterium]
MTIAQSSQVNAEWEDIIRILSDMPTSERERLVRALRGVMFARAAGHLDEEEVDFVLVQIMTTFVAEKMMGIVGDLPESILPKRLHSRSRLGHAGMIFASR